jgi:hypothetical protein
MSHAPSVIDIPYEYVPVMCRMRNLADAIWPGRRKGMLVKEWRLWLQEQLGVPIPDDVPDAFIQRWLPVLERLAQLHRDNYEHGAGI